MRVATVESTTLANWLATTKTLKRLQLEVL